MTGRQTVLLVSCKTKTPLASIARCGGTKMCIWSSSTIWPYHDALTRLIITHIVNENFKSYAGERTLGPFHKSFTSIVGPNGSGKSNVIDSMLFVFGYRAQKIRSKKLSVLIHNSDTHPNVQSCKVQVCLKSVYQLLEEMSVKEGSGEPQSAQ